MAVDVEIHDEVVDWMDGLTDEEWDRVVVIIDRLATLGPQARMPLSRALGDGLFSQAAQERVDRGGACPATGRRVCSDGSVKGDM